MHRTVFTHVFSTQKNICHRETCTHRLHTEVFTDRLFGTQKLYPEQFLHSRNFFAQKPLRTKKICTAVFTDRRFLHTESSPHRSLTHRRFYAQHFLHTDAFTHRCLTQTQIAHRNLCTQHAFTHNQLLHREVLLPLLDHLPFVFPPLKSSWSMNVDVG